MIAIEPIFTALHEFEQQRRQHERQICRQLRLNHADIRLLSYLTVSKQTLQQLQQLTGLDISTLSRQLTALTRKKMLRKQLDQRDRRKRIFTLTTLGQKQFQYFCQASANFEQAILANWTVEEQQLLKVLLGRLLTSTKRLGPTANLLEVGE
ncbi:MarR family winged helix-turn-helix transcriptional regulator [Loigolactobacillus binensis]|uniref:MarR family winged helix-turn-helix transcriptional regulator n=1 Tax=Loigolactobacillus binensis TaxID=2559922 RepID=A0ABW3EDX7_9LACO|nr:MarR family transcriptional regulator [Loigolactobacillus binensis]